MFKGFLRSVPTVSIFHSPNSQPSQQALSLLRSSLSSPYPSGTSKPLEFSLEVIEAPPTAEQLSSIAHYLTPDSPDSAPLSSFVNSGSSAAPRSAQALVQAAREQPTSFKWPVVVDWDAGRASVGDVEGVKSILAEIRKKRDGEVKEEEEHKPKGWFS